MFKLFVIVLVAALTLRAAVADIRAIKVTNLGDSGPGSLRACVDSVGDRVCVFETSGRINFVRPLDIDANDVFIAGQTAASPGILLTGAPLRVRASNVKVEHLEVRVGDAKAGPRPIDRDCVSVQSGATNVVLRHLSLSWAVDENFSTFGAVRGVRLEDSIVAEALYRSIHPKGPHSMGALVGKRARRMSFIGNLFAANQDRNVRWLPNTSGEMVGNVIYGWGGTSSSNTTNLSYGSSRARAISLDILGNVYIPGPSGNSKAFGVYADRAPPGTRVFLADNIAPQLSNLFAFNVSTVRVGGATPLRQPASETLWAVVTTAGSRPWDRNADDIRVISGMLDRSLTIRNQVGAWPVRQANRRASGVPGRFSSQAELRAWLHGFEGVPAVRQALPSKVRHR
jgi:hypothetical protein